jgi:hypothetical protein
VQRVVELERNVLEAFGDQAREGQLAVPGADGELGGDCILVMEAPTGVRA